MGFLTSNLLALRVFTPSSILDKSLEFFEFLRYETKAFRDEEVVSKDDLLDAMSKSIKIKKVGKAKKLDIEKQFEGFLKDLDKILFIKNTKDEITEIKWKR